MRELTFEQVDVVSGGNLGEGLGAFGLALGIGSATFGAKFGVVGVGLAFASAPVAAGAMVGLAFFAGFRLLASR